MKYTKDMLATVVYNDLHNSLITLSGRSDFDVLSSCGGMSWLHDLIEKNNSITIEDALQQFAKCDGDTGAWAVGIMRDVGDKLYPEFRSTVLNSLHGDNCTMVARSCRHKLSSSEKEQLRRQFRAQEEPSTNLEMELK
jgi:hypothetical protein